MERRAESWWLRETEIKCVRFVKSELQAELAAGKRTEATRIDSEVKFKRLPKEFDAILDGITGFLALFDEDVQVVWCNKNELGNINQEGVSPFCYKYETKLAHRCS